MKPIKIFITSWNRQHLTEQVINAIHCRTNPGTFEIHVYDNGSEKEVKNYLIDLLDKKIIKSLMLDSRNTGCLYDKLVFHSMVESDEEYYVVTDNDIIPPKLPDKDWLSRMIEIMEKHPSVALLTPQIPPTWLQRPNDPRDDMVLCEAVGNTFKMIRRKAIYINDIQQKLMTFGDDGLLSLQLISKGWRVGFMRDVFCYNLERDYKNWGYTEEQVKADPRKAGYGPPFNYKPTDWNTLTPPAELIF